MFDFAPYDLEVGYRLRRHAWGRGLATEITIALIDRAFATGDARRVVATTRNDNLASTRVLEKVGMRRHDAMFAVTWSAIPYVKFELSVEAWHAERKRPGMPAATNQHEPTPSGPYPRSAG